METKCGSFENVNANIGYITIKYLDKIFFRLKKQLELKTSSVISYMTNKNESINYCIEAHVLSLVYSS